jgi:hypothetical protein
VAIHGARRGAGDQELVERAVEDVVGLSLSESAVVDGHACAEFDAGYVLRSFMVQSTDGLSRAVGVAAFYYAQLVRLARRVQRVVLEGYRERGGEQGLGAERAPAQAVTYDPKAIHAQARQEECAKRAERKGESRKVTDPRGLIKA